jgi:hypothetical protein
MYVRLEIDRDVRLDNYLAVFLLECAYHPAHMGFGGFMEDLAALRRDVSG